MWLDGFQAFFDAKFELELQNFKANKVGLVADSNNSIGMLSQRTPKGSNYEVRSGGAESHFSGVSQPRKTRKEPTNPLQSPKVFRPAVVSPKHSENTNQPAPDNANEIQLKPDKKDYQKPRKTPKPAFEENKIPQTFKISRKPGAKHDKQHKEVMPIDEFITASNVEVT